MNSSEAKNWKSTQSSQNQSRPHLNPEKVKVKVTHSHKITRGEKYLYILFSLFIVLASLYVVSYSQTTDTMNRELQSFEEKVIDQQFINEGLSFEVKELSQPDRITDIAIKNGLKIQDTEIKRVNTVND